MVNKELDDYRFAISNLGSKLKLFNADDLKSFLVQSDDTIDFIQFCNQFIMELKELENFQLICLFSPIMTAN